MASGCKHEEVSFAYLHNLDNIPILLDKKNIDLKKEITHLFNGVSIFIFKFEKKSTTNQTDI